MSKHYHAINGSIGCIPDSNEIYHTKRDAIDSRCELFEGVKGLRYALETSGIFYFDNPAWAGAEYAEVVCCYDEGCTQDE